MRRELIDSLAQGDFVVTNQLIDEVANVDPDAEFEFGLEVIVRGLESARRCSTTRT